MQQDLWGEFQVSLLKESEGVVTGRLADSTFESASMCFGNTECDFGYVVGAEKSNIQEDSKRQVKDHNQIDDGLPARSEAMVFITVILSVSMFTLLVFRISHLQMLELIAAHTYIHRVKTQGLRVVWVKQDALLRLELG
ncbi:unnamed protein product [Coregonus sp. 'balchen']|nr:unnamed protein product [Coregonus sp. 'balchen']